MIKLFDDETDTEIGTITEDDLVLLQTELVEETLDAYTYNIALATIHSLELNGADPKLISILRGALGTRNSMEVRYEMD